jgi:hypothetical protein
MILMLYHCNSSATYFVITVELCLHVCINMMILKLCGRTSSCKYVNLTCLLPKLFVNFAVNLRISDFCLSLLTKNCLLHHLCVTKKFNVAYFRITRDLGELDKEFSISARKGLSPTSAPHPIDVESHIVTAGLIRHFLTAGESFTLITMSLFKTM